MQRSFSVNKEESKEEVKSKHGGRELTGDELKEHQKSFSDFEESINLCMKNRKPL